MRHANWYNEEYMKSKRAEVARIAHALLEKRINIVDGAQALCSLRHDVTDTDFDEDFTLFVAIASETDHLPVGEIRKQWSSKALEKTDLAIKKIDDLYRAKVIEACGKLLARFNSKSVQQGE